MNSPVAGNGLAIIALLLSASFTPVTEPSASWIVPIEPSGTVTVTLSPGMLPASIKATLFWIRSLAVLGFAAPDRQSRQHHQLEELVRLVEAAD